MERSHSELDAVIVSEQVASGFQDSPVLARIWAGPARALYVGPGLDLSPHLNVATTIAVSLRQPFELRTWAKSGGWSPWRSEVISVIPSETLHHLKSLGPMAFLYLDPLTDRRHPLSQNDLLSGRERLRLAGQRVGLDEAFAAFGLRPHRPRDARIARVVREIERRPDAFGRLQDAAALACLSPSRFRARFDAELGLPFRRYRLWRRMATVMRTVAVGGTLTDAAHAAGFSSSAHLSSTFKRMFGLTASDLLAFGVTIDVSEDEVLSAYEHISQPEANAARAA
ncbi:AraC family transcriptional regulator [Ideonella sp. A 288]|uniref:helix-turn-helix domain-containing protein n=1 Tax=Ideonella sp. A 288 TaxID=1962181 RepID=UPI001303F074|nr:AraC family transcriptional regulator [Ideonella sp. A 288]